MNCEIIYKYIDNNEFDKINVCLLKGILFKFEDQVIKYCVKKQNEEMLKYVLKCGLQVNDSQEELLYRTAYQQHYNILYHLLAARYWTNTILGGVIIHAGPNLFRQDRSLLTLIYGDY